MSCYDNPSTLLRVIVSECMKREQHRGNQCGATVLAELWRELSAINHHHRSEKGDAPDWVKEYLDRLDGVT